MEPFARKRNRLAGVPLAEDWDIYKACVEVFTLRECGFSGMKILLGMLCAVSVQVALLVYVALLVLPQSAERTTNMLKYQLSQQWVLVALCKMGGLAALFFMAQVDVQAAVKLFESVCRDHKQQLRLAGSEGPPCNRWWLLLPPLLQLSVAGLTVFLQGLCFQSYYAPQALFTSDNKLLDTIIFTSAALAFILQLDNQAWDLLKPEFARTYHAQSIIVLMPKSWWPWIANNGMFNGPYRWFCNGFQALLGWWTKGSMCCCCANIARCILVLLFHLTYLSYTTILAFLLILYATDMTGLKNSGLWLTSSLAVLTFLGLQSFASIQLRLPEFWPADTMSQWCQHLRWCCRCCTLIQLEVLLCWYSWVVNIVVPLGLAWAIAIRTAPIDLHITTCGNTEPHNQQAQLECFVREEKCNKFCHHSKPMDEFNCCLTYARYMVVAMINSINVFVVVLFGILASIGGHTADESHMADIELQQSRQLGLQQSRQIQLQGSRQVQHEQQLQQEQSQQLLQQPSSHMHDP